MSKIAKEIIDVCYWLAVMALLVCGLVLAPNWARFLLGGLTLYMMEIHRLLLSGLKKKRGDNNG